MRRNLNSRRSLWISAMIMLVLILSACASQPAAPTAPAAPSPTKPSEPASPATPTFPTKPIHLVVTHEAGGTTDTVGRLVATYAQKELGQPIVIDNMPGAGGQVATEFVWRADPDGYTILIAQDPGFDSRYFMGGTQYKPLDFAHVYNILGHDYNAVAVATDSPIKDIAGLIEASKVRPQTVAMGGVGSNSHLAATVLGAKTGANLQQIPYSGGFGPIRQAVLSKETDLGMGGLLGWLELYGQGQVRILGILGDKRDSRAPEVPTLKELGHPEAILEQFMGVMAPPNTPPEVVNVLAAAFEKAVKDPQFLAAAEKAQMGLAPMGPSEFKTFHQSIYDLVGQFEDILSKK